MHVCFCWNVLSVELHRGKLKNQESSLYYTQQNKSNKINFRCLKYSKTWGMESFQQEKYTIDWLPMHWFFYCIDFTTNYISAQGLLLANDEKFQDGKIPNISNRCWIKLSKMFSLFCLEICNTKYRRTKLIHEPTNNKQLYFWILHVCWHSRWSFCNK